MIRLKYWVCVPCCEACRIGAPMRPKWESVRFHHVRVRRFVRFVSSAAFDEGEG